MKIKINLRSKDLLYSTPEEIKKFIEENINKGKQPITRIGGERWNKETVRENDISFNDNKVNTYYKDKNFLCAEIFLHVDKETGKVLYFVEKDKDSRLLCTKKIGKKNIGTTKRTLPMTLLEFDDYLFLFNNSEKKENAEIYLMDTLVAFRENIAGTFYEWQFLDDLPKGLKNPYFRLTPTIRKQKNEIDYIYV